MEKNTFEISSGGTSLIKGYGYGKSAVTVSDVEGWDEVRMEVNTAPKMSGDGSYTLGEHVSEVTLTATFSVTGTLATARPAIKRLQDNCLTKGSSVTLTLTKDSEWESMTGKIVSVKPQPGASLTMIVVEVLCTNPRKTFS